MRRGQIICALATAAVVAAGAGSPQAAQAQSEVVVTLPTLNVRSAPSTGDSIIGQLTCGQKVAPNAKTADGAWYRIDFNGQSGFIFAQYAVVGGTCATGAAAVTLAGAAPAPAAPPTTGT